LTHALLFSERTLLLYSLPTSCTCNPKKSYQDSSLILPYFPFAPYKEEALALKGHS